MLREFRPCLAFAEMIGGNDPIRSVLTFAGNEVKVLNKFATEDGFSIRTLTQQKNT
jgi:hypothetical protein